MSETKEAKVLGEFETIRIGFEGREEYLEISGNGNVSADYVTHGSNMNLFQTTDYNSNSAVQTNVGWENFQKQSQYLEMLIKVAGQTDHKVNTEIDEALKKLKEITYA